MSFIIKDENGNAVIRRGQKLLGSDSTDAIVKDISVQRRQFTICASSDRKDRLGDIIVQEGLGMKNFNRNPVILWAHRHDQIPIGKYVEHWQEDKGGVTRTMMCVQMSGAEDAVKIFDAVKGGFLRTASVGFLPLKTEPIKQSDKDKDKPPMFGTPTKFLESDLLECSICSVPANPDAMVSFKNMVDRGQLPAYCIGDKCYYDDGADIDLDELERDMKIERALKRLDADVDPDIDFDEEDDVDFDLENFDDEDLEVEDDDDLDLDLSDKETRELIKLAVREALKAALGRLD